MRTALSAWPPARRIAVAVGLLLATTAVVVTSVTMSTAEVSGADDGGSTTFQVAGDGSLPVTKPALGELREALSTEETGYAIHLATTDDSVPAGATDVRGEDGPEVLYVDLPDSLDATTRQAVVSLYDYSTDTSIQQVVDLAKGSVVDSTSTTDLQPPTSSDEADVAIDLAINAEQPLGFLGEFETAMGVPLISADQVTYVAGAFLFDRTTQTGQECGKQRCAQLMVQAPNGGYLSTWDFVVNLSTKSIVTIK